MTGFTNYLIINLCCYIVVYIVIYCLLIVSERIIVINKFILISFINNFSDLKNMELNNLMDTIL